MMGNIEFGLDILSLRCQRHLSGDVECEIETHIGLCLC